MGVVKFAKTGTAPEATKWAFAADEQNAILGPEGDNWARYRDAHTWWDASDEALPTKKAAYALPHHRLSADGKTLEAVWDGVVAAMGRLKQTDMPEGDMKGAFEHLTAHYPQWGKTPPAWDRFLGEVQTRQANREQMRRALVPAHALNHSGRSAVPQARLPLMTTRADILALPQQGGLALAQVAEGLAPLPKGEPTPEMLALINARARSPLAAGEVYVWPAQISNQQIDSFWTRMSPLSLRWFSEDATRGVAICDSHVHGRLPIGRSFYGHVASLIGATLATQSLAYLLRGWQLSNGLNTDDLIRGIESGIFFQVSIGFDPVAFTCSICGRNMLTDFECYHIPGFIYDVSEQVGAHGTSRAVPSLPVRALAGALDSGPYSGYDAYGDGETYTPMLGQASTPEEARYPLDGTAVCVADVDAHLIEYSLVFRHATPDAEVPTGPNVMTLKAEQEAERGRADTRVLRIVEDRCQVRLFDRWNGYGAGNPGQAMPGALGSRESTSGRGYFAPVYAPGGMLPGHNPLAAANEAASGNVTLATHGAEREEEEMRGSEFLREWAESYTRAGKELSATNLADLRAMQSQLQSGHDTMRGGIDLLTAWLAEKGGTEAGAQSNATSAELNAGNSENAAAIASSTVSSESGGSNADALTVIAAQQSRAAEADSDRAATSVSAEDQAVDAAIDAVQTALSALKVAQAKDEASERAIEVAQRALETLRAAKSVKPSAPGTDDGDGDDDSLTPAGASRASESETEDDDTQDGSDETEDTPDDEDDAGDDEGNDEDKGERGDPPDFNAHKPFTGKHEHGDFAMHTHDGDASHDEAPKADRAASERAEDAGGDMGARAASTMPATRAAGQGTPGQGALALTREQRELLEVGRAARARALDEALRAGTAAHGALFNAEAYRPILERASYDELVALTEDWKKAARLALGTRGYFAEDKEIPGGGRFDREPTGQGGRQTISRDAADPLGVLSAGAREQRPAAGPAFGPRPTAQPSRSGATTQPAPVRAGDVGLFAVGYKPKGGPQASGQARRTRHH